MPGWPGLTQVVIWLAEGLGLAVALAATGIVGVRRIRQGLRRRALAAERLLRPMVTALLADEPGPPARRGRGLRRDRHLARIVLAYAAKIQGGDRLPLTALLTENGVLAHRRARLRSPWAHRRVAAVRAVGALALPEDRPRLERRVGDHNAQVRRAAVQALGRLGHPLSVPVLLAALGNSRRPVPQYVLALAVRCCARSDSRALLEALDGADLATRRLAQDVLGWLGEMRAVPRLCETAVRGETALRVGAVAALGRIDDPRAVPIVARVLATDPEPAVRRAAARALGLIGDPRAGQALLVAVRDEHEVATAACVALGRLGPAGLVALQDCPTAEAAEARALVGLRRVS